MPTVLERIVEAKRREVEALRLDRPEDELRRLVAAAAPPRPFRRALEEAPGTAIIAELKRASPSRGRIREDFDPPALARRYVGAGARALSVLTDEGFFEGALAHLAEARAAARRPVLRKDFLIDPLQIWEARAAGADAVLLIAPILDDRSLRSLLALARSLGMDALCEAHDREDLERALAAGADLVGINSRDLRTFQVDLAVAERLAPIARDRAFVVAESGIRNRADIERLEAAGAQAFLVGEALLRAEDAGRALRALLGRPACG